MALKSMERLGSYLPLMTGPSQITRLLINDEDRGVQGRHRILLQARFGISVLVCPQGTNNRDV